eukprot:g9931.t1
MSDMSGTNLGHTLRSDKPRPLEALPLSQRQRVRETYNQGAENLHAGGQSAKMPGVGDSCTGIPCDTPKVETAAIPERQFEGGETSPPDYIPDDEEQNSEQPPARQSAHPRPHCSKCAKGKNHTKAKAFSPLRRICHRRAPVVTYPTAKAPASVCWRGAEKNGRGGFPNLLKEWDPQNAAERFAEEREKLRNATPRLCRNTSLATLCRARIVFNGETVKTGSQLIEAVKEGKPVSPEGAAKFFRRAEDWARQRNDSRAKDVGGLWAVLLLNEQAGRAGFPTIEMAAKSSRAIVAILVVSAPVHQKKDDAQWSFLAVSAPALKCAPEGVRDL